MHRRGVRIVVGGVEQDVILGLFSDGQVATFDAATNSIKGTAGGGGGGGPHATSHQNGGADEISVTGLSGLLADPQTPAAHASTHADGAADEINVTGLSGLLATAQTPATHASMHQDGGAGEISVTALSGLLADPQRVEVARAGTLIGTRKRVNLILGDGVTIDVTDNSGSDRVDVTVGLNTLYNVPTATVASICNPLHWWRADNTVQSGGLVDTITDNGSLAKNFTQTSAARCPTATDGNGQTYLALDGAADYYSAGAVADWKFMNDGTPFTMALIMSQPTLATADQSLLGNAGFDSTKTGFELLWTYLSATQQGPSFAVAGGVAANYVMFVEDRSLTQAIQVLIIRGAGSGLFNRTLGNVVSGAATALLQRHGSFRALSPRNATNGFNTVNPTYSLTLGARDTGVRTLFSSARIYDVILDNKLWSNDLCSTFERYARGKGCSL